eukprot:TRINITY_DN13555_c0_g1_i1.p1 TRINITY_DN13555_c0_g1~~TRINITY_DN13555_c0_g1_i1.p1  ORF type:complete len:370 (+),score=83.25 TRINITY_DN13555_c0_g1_i1:78-1112(+)
MAPAAAKPKSRPKAQPKAEPTAAPTKTKVQQNPEAAAKKEAPQEAVKPKNDAPITTRAELVRGVFDTFDRDCDDLLNPKELRRFADSVGFEGDESDWIDWYRDTCTEVGANRNNGVDRAQFLMLTKDAEDEDLFRLCGKRRPQAATRHMLTVRAVFDMFDRDCDAVLNRVELRRFMDNLDFEGSDEEWQEKYLAICKDVGANPQKGVDISQFSLVCERNATDAELELMRQELDAMLGATIGLDVWSKMQPGEGLLGESELLEEGDPPRFDHVQGREPPPPELTTEGAPLVQPPTRPVLSAKDRKVGIDDAEMELDFLRKTLTDQKAPHVTPVIQLPPIRIIGQD